MLIILNCILSVRGDVKMFDFGLACIIPDGNANNEIYDMSGAGEATLFLV